MRNHHRRPRQHVRLVKTKRGRKRITVNRGIRGRPRDVRRKIIATDPHSRLKIGELIVENPRLALKIRKGVKDIVAGTESFSDEDDFLVRTHPNLLGFFKRSQKIIGLPREDKIDKMVLTHEATHAAIDAKLRDLGTRPNPLRTHDDSVWEPLSDDAEIMLQFGGEEAKRAKRLMDESPRAYREFRDKLHQQLRHSKKLRDLPDVFIP